MPTLPQPTPDSIIKSIKSGNLAPVYVLHGEETYHIDRLAAAFEGILTEDEKVFDQYILYAPDTEISTLIGICKGIPAIAKRQVVILKEVQTQRADWIDKLAPYVAAPVSTTVLVICSRGAALKGKSLTAALKKGGAVVYESKKIADYNAAPYIESIIKEKGLTADSKAVAMLLEFVGTDLSRIHSEVGKLATLLPPGAAITPEVVEQNIGISREYNSFELVDAIAEHNAAKSFRIAAYFRSNPKAAPLVMVTASLFNFFADVLTAYYVPGGSDMDISKALNLRNSFALKRIRRGMANYKAVQVVEIIGAIRDFDARSKGVESRQNEHVLFNELIYHILSAPGRV